MPRLLRIILMTLLFAAVSGGAFAFFWYKDTRMPKKQVEEKNSSFAIVQNTAEEDDTASQLELATSTGAAIATTTLPAEEIKDKDEPASAGPEIPVEQYWAFATMNDLKIYVNNTDRNVIYALNDKGKIVWQIWGKDYGFEKFEIWLKDNRLYVSASIKNAKYPSTGLWVIGADGKVAWKYDFLGYLDDSQRVYTKDGRVLIENIYQTPSSGGTELRMFDVATGKVLWSKGPVNFYGHYNFLLDNGNILSKSGGLGIGRFTHQYEFDGQTGELASYKIIIDDNELVKPNYPNLIQNYRQLIFDVPNKKISLAKYSDNNQISWTLGEDSELYKLVNGHLTQGLRVAVLSSVIQIEDFTVSTSTVSSIFSLENGGFLWKKDLSSDKLTDIIQRWESGGNIGVRMKYRSSCDKICNTCPENQLVCGDTESSTECIICQQNETKTSGYIQEGLRSFDVKTGDFKWEYALPEGSFWINGVNIAASTVSVSITKWVANFDNGTQSAQTNDFILDAKTGKVK